MKHPNPEALQRERDKLVALMSPDELEAAYLQQLDHEVADWVSEQRQARYQKSAAEWLDYLKTLLERHGVNPVLRVAAWLEADGNLPPGWGEWLDEVCSA